MQALAKSGATAATDYMSGFVPVDIILNKTIALSHCTRVSWNCWYCLQELQQKAHVSPALFRLQPVPIFSITSNIMHHRHVCESTKGPRHAILGVQCCDGRQALVAARPSCPGRKDFIRADLVRWGLLAEMGTDVTLQVSYDLPASPLQRAQQNFLLTHCCQGLLLIWS